MSKKKLFKLIEPKIVPMSQMIVLVLVKKNGSNDQNEEFN